MTSAPWAAEGRLGAGGRSLHYACWGPPPDRAPTLVLLHEGLGSVGLWRGFPAALAGATGLGVMAYSRAGHGRSEATPLPRPLDYMTREAAVLSEVLDAIGLRRGVLVGHSDGATIAAIHAGTTADPRVRGAVLMAPHFFTEPSGLAEIARARDAWAGTDLPSRMARHHDDAAATFRGWNDAWLDPGFADWDVTDVLEGIRVPVLAMQGAADQYGTLAQIDVVAARCPAAVERRVLDDCRHAPFLDRPEATRDAVAAFARRVLADVPAA